MNEEPRSLNGDDEQSLDLLVDGELDEPRRRELLQRLDAEPDGWRRCALAFLEAQTWRQAVRDEKLHVPSAPAPADVSAIPLSMSASRLWWVRPSRPVLVLAATFLLAFVLGWATRGLRAPASALSPSDGVSATGPTQSNAPPSDAASSTTPPEETPAAALPFRVAGLVTWKIELDGTEREVAVPVVEGPGIDKEWLMQQPPAVPEAVRLALQNRGHRLVTHRRLIETQLADGRQVVLPVEQVELHFAARVPQ